MDRFYVYILYLCNAKYVYTNIAEIEISTLVGMRACAHCAYMYVIILFKQVHNFGINCLIFLLPYRDVSFFYPGLAGRKMICLPLLLTLLACVPGGSTTTATGK